MDWLCGSKADKTFVIVEAFHLNASSHCHAVKKFTLQEKKSAEPYTPKKCGKNQVFASTGAWNGM